MVKKDENPRFIIVRFILVHNREVYFLPKNEMFTNIDKLWFVVWLLYTEQCRNHYNEESPYNKLNRFFILQT